MSTNETPIDENKESGTNPSNDSGVSSSEIENSEKQTGAEAGSASQEDKIQELNDKYIRLYSDFDNFRKRSIKEKAEIISTASADVLKDLLVVLDDFERAIANNEKVDDVALLRESFKLIQHKLVHVLQQKGLESIESKGEVFDADKHEAITNVPVGDESLKGKVIDVVERGYNLRGRTLRFAKVIVGQ